MVVKYEGGESTYFPGFKTSDSTVEYLEPSEVARRVLRNRREIALLDLPSVMRVGEILAQRVRRPDVWIRNAVTTLDRFQREVCNGDLEGTLHVCLQEPMSAELLLENYRRVHSDLTNIQMAALLFGPKLWLAFNGVEFVWDEGYAERPRVHVANSAKGDFDPATRLFMLSLIGTGLNFDELATIRIKDAGSLDGSGKLVPNLRSNPLAVEFDTDEGRRITFFGEEARASLMEALEGREFTEEEPLVAPIASFDALREAAEAMGKSTIASNSRVDRMLCSTVGSFFLKWGIPGRNFYAENGLPNPYEDKSNP